MEMENRHSTGRYESIRLDNQLCFPLYLCAKEVVRLYRKPLEKLGLTYTQYVVMMALWERSGITEGELGKTVHLDSGTLTPLLKRLEKQGYISRRRADSDERRLILDLTEAGLALQDRAIEVPVAMRGCIGLPDEELFQLKRLLDKALDRMDAE